MVRVWKQFGNRCVMQRDIWGSRSRDQNFASPKVGKKLKNLNQYISAVINIDEKRFMIFEHTINHLSFGYVRLSQLEYYFSCFASFFLLFFSTECTAFKV